MLYDIEQQYLLAFRQGAIGDREAQIYMKLLKKDTLDYITHISFDRRLLKPIMKIAWEKLEETNAVQEDSEEKKTKTTEAIRGDVKGEKDNDVCKEEFDRLVNEILWDRNQMFNLMASFCL